MWLARVATRTQYDPNITLPETGATATWGNPEIQLPLDHCRRFAVTATVMASLPLDLLRDAGVRLDGHTEAASLSLTGKVASLAHSHATKDVKAEEWTSILADLQRLSPSSVPIGQDVAAVTISTQEEKMKASPKIGSGSLDMGANRQSLPDGTSVLATLHELRQIFRRLEYFQGDGEAFVVTQSSANDAFTRLSATVHALALQALLNEAHTSRERGWTWRTIHDETSAALWYFAQTLPGRCVYAAQQLAGLILPSVRHESATQNLSSSPSVNVKEAPSQAHGQLENVWSLLKGPPALLLFTLFPWSMAGPQSTGLRPQGLGTPSATSVVSKMSSVGINLRTVLQPDVGQSKTGLTNYLASVASKGQGFDAQLARSLSRATRETRRMLLTPGSLLTLPLRLIRDEARAKERALKNHTHELAMAIGYVAAELQAIGASHISASSSTAILPTMSQVKQLKSLFSSPDHVQLPSASEESLGTTLGALNVLEDVLTRGLTISSLNKGERTQTVAARSLGLYMPSPIGLSTPALWSRIWFKLIGYPLAGFSIYRLASANQATLKSTALAAWDTVKGLVVNWVFDPVANFVRTLQHGSGHAHGLTAPLSLESDQDSLARMVTAFAHDMSQHRSAASAVTSNLSQDQINLMSERVKMGDLSPVMTVYEEQLKVCGTQHM